MINDGAWTRGYETFFMLNSTEHEILSVKIIKLLKNKVFSCIALKL